MRRCLASQNPVRYAGKTGARPRERLPRRPAAVRIPNLGTASRAWFRRAAQLDWSKCAAAQSVQGKTGKVWMVRGTDAPLAEVLQSVADGHPFLEIAEVFEITLQQLIAVLQFAAENAAPASAGR